MRSNFSILVINAFDIGGGAEKIAMDLHRSYLALGHESVFLVGNKQSDLLSVIEIPPTAWRRFWGGVDREIQKIKFRGLWCFHRLINIIQMPYYYTARRSGRENFHYPESRRMVNKLQQDADVIHLHNLHNEYFDLRMLPNLSKRKPVIITLHDEYLLTGHCALSLGCGRWRIGCGKCPHLDVYPAVRVDNTRYNWQRKQAISSKSDLTLVTPSAWLAERARESLLSSLPVRVLPNGIDLSIFKPGSQPAARKSLGLDQKAFILLHTAAGGRKNHYKDYEMLDRVVARLKNQSFNQPVILLALGGNQDSQEKINNVTMVEKSYINDPLEIARYYQACDLYIHTAKTENAPLVILEAMACGKPIVSTNAGGIPELVREGETGYAVPIGDDEGMVNRILTLINDPGQRDQMGIKAAKVAKVEYGLNRMVDDYLNLYQELIDARNG